MVYWSNLMYLKHRMANFLSTLTLGSIVVFICGIFTLSAQADILISPQRVTLNDESRQAILSLHNPGDVPRAYSLKWVERRLTEGGELIQLKDGENPSSITSMVRFSPRRVVIEPGKTQTVRLDYRPPVDLKPGEYRSHIRIGMEPLPNVKNGTEVKLGEQGGMSFRLEALMSFTVPVFVRHGAGTATVNISAVEPVQIKRGGLIEPGLKVNLTREGAFSSYGRLVVYQQINSNSPVEVIGLTEGVSIYAEINALKRELLLKPGTQLKPGSWVRITYEGEGSERGQVFAERAFQIGK
jgi:P pilus assembly chaperone PapD